MFHMPSGVEWIILLAIVLVLFGPGKLTGVGKSLGTAISEFKDAMSAPKEKAPDDASKNETKTT